MQSLAAYRNCHGVETIGTFCIESVELRPFKISLSGIGAFRDLWWAGIENSPPLAAVARRLRRALSDADVPFDRKNFNPLITIMRKADGSLSDIPEDALAAHKGVSMTVDHISLMRSDRGKQGMIYTKIGAVEARNVL